LWKCHNPLNDLSTYHVNQAGKELKSFSDLEPLWATGNYEEVFRLRGRKSLIGVNLKAETEPAAIVVQDVQLHSPGFLAGIRRGDVITAIDDQAVVRQEDLIRRIVASPFGKEVRLDLRRDGRPLSLQLVPGTIPRNFVDAGGRPVTSSEERLWRHYRKLDTAEGYTRYLESVALSPYRDEAGALRTAAIERERSRIDAAVRAEKPAELASYLASNPGSPLRDEAVRAAVSLLERSKSRGAAYSEFVDHCPHCAALLPRRYAILAVGPAGMTVADIVRLQAQGVGADILAAKIEGGGGEYKDFSFEEIAFLNDLQLSSGVITAMIRSTHAQSARRLQDENRKLQQENVALRQQQATQTAAAPAASAGAAPSVVEECAKLAAALAACDQGGGFLKTGCRIIAQSTFQCPLPGYR
jgi:hypothetical protein